MSKILLQFEREKGSATSFVEGIVIRIVPLKLFDSIRIGFYLLQLNSNLLIIMVPLYLRACILVELSEGRVTFLFFRAQIPVLTLGENVGLSLPNCIFIEHVFVVDNMILTQQFMGSQYPHQHIMMMLDFEVEVVPLEHVLQILQQVHQRSTRLVEHIRVHFCQRIENL